MSLWSTLSPDEQLLTEPTTSPASLSPRTKTSVPTWPPTGGRGAGPGPG